MKRILYVVALAVAAGAGACGDAHLGPNVGKRTRTALDAQTGEGREGVTLDAADAKNVMTKHHAQPGQQGQPAALGPAAAVPAIVPTLRMPGINPGGAIKMDAKER